MRFAFTCAALLVLLLSSGCYSLRLSSGAGQITTNSLRRVDPSDIALVDGYAIEPVAARLTFPTGVTFDQQGRPCIVESGYCYGEVWTTPRLLRIESNGDKVEIARGSTNGPWTGVIFHEGSFYVAEGGVLEGGKILRISEQGEISALVTNLPSFGDHHSNGPMIGPDGWLYFGQGTASNSGIVGEDNAKFGWLKRRPDFHDIPGQDITLVGQNYTPHGPLPPRQGETFTGAFLPYGTPSESNQVIKGQVPCSGSVLRVKPGGGPVELVAWGFRNPFGLAFDATGVLYVTDNGYDDRGSRPVWGAPDVLWRVEKGIWYGWPDYAAGLPLNTTRFKPPLAGKPEFLLASHPNQPPQPVAIFGVHSSADGFDFSRNTRFGYEGQAFVALLGDEAPAVGKVLYTVGAKVVRVDLTTGLVEEFAVNRGKKNAPASKLESGGFERPIAARFNPAGDILYVVDFGIIKHTDAGAEPEKESGVLWRIKRQ